ncbi:MAG: hypothetical protein Q7R49_04355 [Candidatus Daviesbacteria bacterium]|nr:hypothetical protein [Candidatus Daviesbacteria bacterium]
MVSFLSKYNLPKITLVLSCLLLTIIFLFNPHYIYTTGLVDQWFAVKGLTIYKQFNEFHFPFGYLTSIALRLATNWNLELDPFFGLFFGIGMLIILYKIGTKFLTPIGNIVSLLFFTLFFWYAATGIIYYDEILIGFLVSVLLFFVLNFNLKNSKIVSKQTLFLIGIIFALTEFTGQIVTLTLGVFFLYLTRSIYQFKKPLSIFLSAYIPLIIGVVLIIIIFSSYFIFHNAFQDFFYYNVIYYIQYAGYEKNLLGLPKDQIVYFYSPMLIMVLIILVGLFKKKQIVQTQVFLLISSLSTIPFIIFSVYHPHHFSYALPILAITAGACIDFKEKSTLLKAISCTMILIPSCIAIIAIIPWHTSRIVFPPSMKIFNDVYPQDNNPINQISAWLKVNASSDSKILVVGSPIVYIKTNLLPASRPAKGMPEGWEPLDKIKAEILATPPDYWIVDQNFIKRLVVSYHKPAMGNFVEEEINKCYLRTMETHDWEIWKRNLSCKIDP